MLLQRDQFFQQQNESFGVCGLFIDRPGDPSIHVGLYWKYGGRYQLFHLLGANDIALNELSISEYRLPEYYFSELQDVHDVHKKSIIGIAKFLSENPPDDLYFELGSIIYNGGEWNLVTGEYLSNTDAPNFINCGVFVLSMLRSIQYELLEWETWPQIAADKRNTYLQAWLDHHEIPLEFRDPFYNFNRYIRGRHILAATLIDNKPVRYEIAEPKSQELIEWILN